MRTESITATGLPRKGVADPAGVTSKKGRPRISAWRMQGFDAHFREQAIMKYCYPEDKTYITSERFDTGSHLRRIFEFTSQLLTLPLVASASSRASVTESHPEDCMGDIAEFVPQFLTSLERRLPILLAEYPFYSLHPILDAVTASIRGSHLFEVSAGFARNVSGLPNTLLATFPVQMLALKNTLQQAAIVDEIKAYERIFRNRRGAVQQLLEGVQKACSKVTFINIVMGGSIDGFHGADSIGGHLQTSDAFLSEAGAFVKRRDRFIYELHQKFGRNLLGYVWRIDCNPAQGFQLSAILSFNGHKFESEGDLELDVGRMWIATAQNEGGSHWGRRLQPLLAGLQQSRIGTSTPADLPRLCSEIAEKFCFTDRYLRLKLPYGVKGFRKQINHKRDASA